MQRKTGTRIASPEAEKLFLERAGSFSGADIEALLVRARMMAVLKVSGTADVATEGPGAAGAEPELASTAVPPAGSSGSRDVTVDFEALKAAIEDFIPPSYPEEIELQNLAAVLECTSRSLLPEIYRKMDRGEVMRRARVLRELEAD